MRQIKNKDQFFKILENELLKHFSVKDSVEVLEDYKMFYREKEERGETESKILLEMENPYDIVNALLSEDIETRTQLSKIIVSSKASIVLGIGWIAISLVFFILMEFVNVSPETGITLLILQILGFWLLFSYRKFVLNKYMQIENKSKAFVFFILLMVLVTHVCIIMMYRFSLGPETAPVLSMFSANQIGPLIHYIIMFSIVICLLSIYFVYYKYRRYLIHILVTFMGGFSTFILLSLHARLGNLDNMEAFALFMKNQWITYTVVTFIGIGIYSVLRRPLFKEKSL